MVGLSGLIDALAQDDIDQRVVADHLVLLLKALKNSTPHVPTAEAASTLTPRVSTQNPAKVTKPPSTDGQQYWTKGDPIETPIIPAQQLEDVWEASVEDRKQKNRDEGEREEPSLEPLRAQQVQQDRVDNEGDESMETQRVSDEGGVKRKPKVKMQLQMGLLQELLRSFRGGMLRVNSNLRADMFRAVRYLVRTSEDAEVVRRQRFDLFIALSLSRDNTKLWERMQALKLMKQIMSVDSNKLPREAVRMVVAVSGHKEDNFRRVCLETLCELTVANPRIVAHANGFQVFLSASIDPDIQDLADLLMTTLMSVLEDPSTRQFVRPHLELHQLLSGFTDLDYPAGPDRAHLWQSTRKVLVVVMRNWAGVHLLASDSRGLVALMRLLRDQSAFGHEAELQNIILDTINDIFAPFTAMGKASSADEAQNPRELSSSEEYFPSYDPGSAARSSLWMKKGPEPHNMLSYATILCVAFVHCGLIPSLTTLSISAGSENLREKAANLLEGFLRLCGMLLSQNQCTRLLAMPGLVQIAAESETGSMAAARGGARFCHLMRSRASRASDLILRLHGALGTGSSVLMSSHWGLHNQNDLSPVTVGELFHKVYDADRAYHNLETLRRAGWEHSETLEQMRKDLRLSIESSVEKRVMDRQMSESKVLAIKDWTKWDWDVVDDIVQDTLPHPPRLADALRTKWIKRVSGFYRFRGADNIDSGASTGRAGDGGLHNMPWDPDHIRHIGCAGRLYSLLLQHPEGLHFLQTEPRGSLIQETVKELEALVARRRNSGGSSSSIVSSKVFDMESCQRHLSAGYLTLLFSVAAAYDAGRDLLADGGLWNHLTAMGGQPELDYLSRIVLVKISLSDKPIPRKLLKAWLSTGSSQLRLFAVNLLRSALKKISTGDSEGLDYSITSRAGNINLEDPTHPEEWYVEGLVGQLNSDDPTVARAALSVLEEATQDERCLRSLVHQLLAKPELINISGASNLFMRCLSVPEGIQYLENVGWVERMLREWKANGSTTGYSWIIDETWKAHVNGVGCDEDSREPEAVTRRGGISRIKEKVIPIKTNSISIQHFMWEGTGRGGPWDGLEMQLLMSLPWNIEVMLSHGSMPTGGMQLRLDTWVDASPQDGSQSSDMSKRTTGAQSATTMVIRGTVVDSNGTPACHPLEADVTLHARLCVGTCPVDRKGNVQWYPKSTDKQTAPFGRNRTSRNMRSPRSPQHGRADHSAYGGVTMYRGLPDLSPVDDSSVKEHQDIWSTCKPHQRVAGAPPTNLGSESCRSGRSTPGMHAVADYLKSVHDGALDAEDRDALAPSVHIHDHGHRRGIREDSDNLGSRAASDARIPHEGRERVVRVHNETARWIFANQLDVEETRTMQVSENTSITYLKAVEMTIYLQDVGPSPTLPPHLYGQLAKTERGCELLRAHADLKNLLHIARNPTAPANERKGALWAVAHVSSWPLGLTLLEQIQEDVVSMLLSLCTAESHLSVWGTSFCVVNLIARTARGRAAIKAAGWESARDPSTSIFLPQDPTVLFQPVPWKFEGSVTQGLEEQPSDPIIDRLRQDLPANEAEVVNHVAKLSSHISRKDAMKKLNRMRRDKAHRDCFTSSLPVFLLVHQLLADYSFSLPVRRYILGLFEQVAPGVSDWEPYIV